MKKYIVLDSNIFVSFLETGFRVGSPAGNYNEPEDPKILDKLLLALDAGKIELLLPEVITLELERIEKEKKEDLEKMYEEAIKQVREFISSTGKQIAETALSKIEANMKKLCEKEKRKNDRLWKLLNQIFKHKNTKILLLDEQILLSAYKRGLKGKKPFVLGYGGRDSAFKKALPSHNIQPDCIVIENIKVFLSDKTAFYLYLCTNDVHFYESIDKKKLDPDIKSELKVKFSSTTLSELLKKAIGLRTIKKPKAKREKQRAFPIVGKDLTEEGKGLDTLDVVKG